MPKGSWTREYTVWCGMCVKWDQLSGYELSAAQREVRKIGWAYTKEKGWLCPDCSKRFKAADKTEKVFKDW